MEKNIIFFSTCLINIKVDLRYIPSCLSSINDDGYKDTESIRTKTYIFFIRLLFWYFVCFCSVE